MRELADEIHELRETCAVNLHGDVLAVEDDAVLVVVDVWRVLEEPGRLVDGDGDGSVVLPRRMIDPPRVALIFWAQLALWVRRRRQVPCCRNRQRVFPHGCNGRCAMFDEDDGLYSKRHIR